MCVQKDEVVTKVDRLIAAIEGLQKAIEVMTPADAPFNMKDGTVYIADAQIGNLRVTGSNVYDPRDKRPLAYV